MKDINGQTYLHVASIHGFEKLADFLLNPDSTKEKGMPNVRVEEGKIWKDHLLKNLVNVTDIQGKTPLHYASEKGHLSVVNSLIKYGASVNIADKKSKTPLHYSIKDGHFGISEILMRNDAVISSGELSQLPLKYQCRFLPNKILQSCK